MNELHFAARDGSIERTLAVLSRGGIDIDQGDPDGFTPLMIAALYGNSQVVRVLLNKGANVLTVADGGGTTLHVAVQEGHLAVTKLLVKAGADLDAKSSTGGGVTPLHMAACRGYSEVMEVLIEAGANRNSRTVNGTTPLFMAAVGGHVDAIKVLLSAKADPLLTYSTPSGKTFLPLDAAASGGHLEVVHELIQEHGIEGCGGASNGVQALQAAARSQHVEVMGMLTGAGAVDTGAALRAAAFRGCESSVKFLLQQWKRNRSGERAGYLETYDPSGRTSMLYSIEAGHPCSPRITRLLVDAGADTTTAVRVVDGRGAVFFDDTPLVFTEFTIHEKTEGEDAAEEQLHSLEASRRLLMRVEAIHAVSWLWASDDATSVTDATAKGRNKAPAKPTLLTSMLPILRRRVQKPRVLVAALSRHSGKPY